MFLISNFRKFHCPRILGRHYFGHLSKNESTKPVDVSWRCNRPSDKRYPRYAQSIENTVTTVARKLCKGMAIIRYVGTLPSLTKMAIRTISGVSREQLVKVQPRKEPHRTTRMNGKWIKYPNHITANFFTNNGKEGLSSHIYVSDDNQHLIEPTASKPNPKTWPIPEHGNKENHRIVNKPLKNDKSSKRSLRRRRAK